MESVFYIYFNFYQINLKLLPSSNRPPNPYFYDFTHGAIKHFDAEIVGS